MASTKLVSEPLERCKKTDPFPTKPGCAAAGQFSVLFVGGEGYEKEVQEGGDKSIPMADSC